MTVKVTTARFGTLDIEDDKIIAMPDGMVGFGERRFVFLNPDREPFYWFQAVDNPDLAFVVVDPTRFVPGYGVKLTREERDKLGLEREDEALILSVVTMAPDPRQITVNLQGPIVVNPARMTARQIVLEGTHATRHPLFAADAPARSGEAAAPESPGSRLSPLYGLGFALACP